ncbi:MAG: rod shape-determining protein MreC [Burkholderiaceae bacterium]|jgi:rod shape-determining protein MreC|nr:rod shape-determining protein MreC [Burkholderiaceae bacterium]
MSLGNFDRTPPPFFRQGPSALTKLAFFSALALFLMVADTRFEFAKPLRAGVATALLPVQRVLNVPVQLWQGGADYLRGLNGALASEKAAQAQLAQQAEKAARAERLERENQRLRALLELRPMLQVRSIAAEVLYEAADPFSRKLFLDRGAAQGVVLGAPVVGPDGVLGQVTRVFPLSSQVTLLIDKDAAIPVLNARTLARSAAFGGAGGDAMELRFMAANADVQVGDELMTSGVDGVYPPGLSVARVTAVERRAESGFARILLAPSASSDGVRHVLVLEPLALQQPPREEPTAPVDKPERPSKGPRR